jgi:hypothetical protein|tara:strand:- start:554 stop:1069 length:516 start_codon:yes stop_codon:yes gene_type:complete
MAEVLLINRADIMRITGLSGNIDEDKILPHVMTAQDIHLQPIIGTNLMQKVKDLIEDDELDDAGNEYYATLENTYITPTLVYLVMWDFLPFLQYEISNGGINQHTTENGISASEENMNMLIKKFKDKAEFYGNRMSDYICDNSSEFPEISAAITGGELNSEGQQNMGGWVI